MSGHSERNDIDDFFSSDRVSGRDEVVTLDSDDYREHLLDVGDPMLAQVRGMDFEQFTDDRHQAPFLRELLEYWRGLYDEPFVGITTNGVRREGLYALPASVAVDPAPAAAARALLMALNPGQRTKLCYAIDAPEWRGWSNPEFVFFRTGLRLEEQSDDIVRAALAVIEASLSPEGYARVTEAMALNGYLGELVDLPTIMNDRSYWFAVFGEPTATGAWGWQLFGHHVAVNFVSVAGRHVIAPVFLGAEPALSDERAPLFDARERRALALAASWDDAQRAQAVVYASVLDPAMPEGRLHPADERHVGGAFRDNRVVPTEGLTGKSMAEAQWVEVREIAADFLALLSSPQRDLTLTEFDAHRAETYVSWYGATDGTQPFYFRIQSPVILAELDHHAGVWLGNRLPARFHVHTTLRHPNGNDYGKAYLAEWSGERSA